MVNFSNEHIPIPRTVDIISQGVWGPIIGSVGNLVTIVLVLISDVSRPAMYLMSCHEFLFLIFISWMDGAVVECISNVTYQM